MRRAWVALLILSSPLGACWRTAAPGPPPVALPSPPSPVTVDESIEPKPCAPFDTHNPSCHDQCPRDAPDDWPACVEALRQTLARGFACTSNSPWSCTPKPPCPPTAQCQPIHARVIALTVSGSDVVLTIAGGKNLGITPSWKATLTDRNQKPIANGTVKLEMIYDNRTIGRITMTADQLRNTPYVLLEP